MKVSQVKRIDTEENKTITEENIEYLIEAPLMEPIKIFDAKNIKTLMSSCNEFNVNPVREGNNIFTSDIKQEYRYKHVYSFGYGYAYVMLDYDSLSAENRDRLKSMYENLNQNSQEPPIRNIDSKNGYISKKRMVYAVNPELKQGQFRISRDYPEYPLSPDIESVAESADKSNDEFFINNYDVIPTSTRKARFILLRYPVNKETETNEVAEYFSEIANNLAIQEKVKTFSVNRIKIQGDKTASG